MEWRFLPKKFLITQRDRNLEKESLQPLECKYRLFEWCSLAWLISCHSMRVNLPPHTLGSQWNVRFNTSSGPEEFDALEAKAVQVKDGQTQLTITMDHLPSDVSSIEIDTRLYNGIGSTLTERETLPRIE